MKTIDNFAILLADAGLTLNAQVFVAGVAAGDRITTGFTDLGGGCYDLSAVQVADNFIDGTLAIYDGSAVDPLAIGYLSLPTAEAVLTKAAAVDGKTLQQALQYMAAMLAGIVSGARTGAELFKGLDGVTDRVAVTTDTSGNRLTVVYDPE
jgi:hypothetical protein